MKPRPKWRRFEELVAKIQRELAPNAVVTHDDKIMGHESATSRQIDVTVKQKIGQYNMLVAIDCKDYKRAVNVGEVEKFIFVIKDIKANKGVMVAANGFTSTAKRVGEKAGLELYRLMDTEAQDWQTYVSISVSCDFRRIQKFRFLIPSSIASSLPSMNPNEIAVYGPDYPQNTTLVDLLKIRWNSGKLPTELGEHHDIPFAKVLTGFTKDEVFEDEVLLHMFVERRLFFGQLPIIKGKGFINEYTGNLLTTGFTTDWLDAAEVEKEWQQLDNINEIAVNPVLKLVALDKFEIPVNPE